MNLNLITAAASRAGRLQPGFALAALLMLLSQRTAAETSFVPYVDSTITYDNNIYRVTRDSEAPLANGKRTNADFIFNNALGVKADYLWAQQRFYAQVEGSRFNYLNLSNLDQNAYNYGGGLDWVLFSRINGSFSGSQVRSRSSFADRDVTVLNTQRTRLLNGAVNFLLTNDIRVDGGYGQRLLQTPVIGSPSLELEENSTIGSIKYLGINRLKAGFSGAYVNGKYRGTANNTTFKQYSGSGLLEYQASDISELSLTLGYTRREDEGRAGAAAGFTGALDYQRELTGKTKVRVRLLRDVASFDAGDNSVISTGGTVKLDWDATAKTVAGLGYSYTDSVFQDSGASPNNFTGRKDRTHEVQLTAGYEALRWLSLAPSISYTRRESNVSISNYDGLVFALQLTASWQ